jgi:peptidoglycan hydrolase-like protein with peptidoglycan-binding domain
MTIGGGHHLRSSRFAGDEVLEACYNNERVLQRGDSGSAVKKVQEALIILGIPVPRVGASGVFGDETDLAVRSYQEARGLEVDGVIGPETIGSLDAEFHAVLTEPSVSPATEPYVSDIPSPLVPESPGRSPRMSPVSPPKEPKIPPLKAPKVPPVKKTSGKIPQPSVPPVAETPIIETQAAPLEQAPHLVSRPVTAPATAPAMMIDSQGLKLHSAGTWEGNTSFEVEAGKSIHFEVTNSNTIESNIQIKANTGEVAKSVLPSKTAVDLEFSMADKEPFNWRFYIEIDNQKALIDWKLYSNWVPGYSENP